MSASEDRCVRIENQLGNYCSAITGLALELCYISIRSFNGKSRLLQLNLFYLQTELHTSNHHAKRTLTHLPFFCVGQLGKSDETSYMCRRFLHGSVVPAKKAQISGSPSQALSSSMT